STRPTPLRLTQTSLRPRHTLFPYTTLFRSHREQQVERHLGRGVRQRVPVGFMEQPLQEFDRGQLPATGQRDRGASGGLRRDTWLDRKSTRLNSSHQIISYAVFCLKKKTCSP